MDLAKESRPNFKINGKLVTLLLNIPGLWLTFHIISKSIISNRNFPSTFFLDLELNNLLIEDFKFYRDKFYFLYIVIIVVVGINIMMRSSKKTMGSKTSDLELNNIAIYLIPGVIQGLLFVTFSYTLAGILLKIYLTLMKLI